MSTLCSEKSCMFDDLILIYIKKIIRFLGIFYIMWSCEKLCVKCCLFIEKIIIRILIPLLLLLWFFSQISENSRVAYIVLIHTII
jgi:hypothetical protein